MISVSPLVAGFARFRAQHIARGDVVYRQLVENGQQPKILIVGCCDSRVDPALIFDCEPGDLFVIRNVANLVPPNETEDRGYHGTSAALEYGVCNLAVQHIIVLGHAHCGGIKALMEDGGSSAHSYMDEWVKLVDEARLSVARDCAEASAEQRSRECEKRAILVSLQNLLTFPWIKRRVAAGSLQLHGWYFEIESGLLLAYNDATACFEAL